MVRLLVADNSVLVREGLKALLNHTYHFTIDEVADAASLLPSVKKNKPQILVVDPVSMELSAALVSQLKAQHKNLYILAISNRLPKNDISLLLNAGVTSFLLKECDKQEICEAIESTQRGVRFLCGQIVDVLVSEADSKVELQQPRQKISCSGMAISDREGEIIKHIALGLSNKQIADKLCLSFHTVHTHRKNIMQKLKVNNTAGVVMFAVKNNLLADEIHAN